MRFEFKEKTHTFTVDGQVIPSVTQILKIIGLVQFFNCDGWYLKRGQIIHQCCHMIDQGILDPNSIDPQIEGYIEAYLKFKDEYMPYGWEHAEEPLYHPTYLYGGIPDRWGPLYDLKSGAGDVLQLEAYAELLRANSYDPGRQGYMLRLKEDGTYKLETHRYDRKLLGVFLSAVSVFHYRKERGLL
jgi:hypothetical protein